MQILVLTDDLQSASAIADGLRAAGHTVRSKPSDTQELTMAEPGAAIAGDGRPDVVVAFGPHPTEALKRFANTEPPPSVIALLKEENLAEWTPDGPFTDFALAPYRSAELAARIALHHVRSRVDTSDILQSGSLCIDVSNYSVHVHNERIELTYKEYELLKFLVSHPGRVFTRESLLEQVWGYDYWGGSRTIDVHIRRIRSKLPVSVSSLIETVHQVGYRYATPRD